MTIIQCRECLCAPPAVDGLCVACAPEFYTAKRALTPAEQKCSQVSSCTLASNLGLPPGFINTEEFADLIERQVRTARDWGMELDLSVKFSRPMGGVQWGIYEPGFLAYQARDTGDLCDARRFVAGYNSR